jgi:hypothetical protein
MLLERIIKIQTCLKGLETFQKSLNNAVVDYDLNLIDDNTSFLFNLCSLFRLLGPQGRMCISSFQELTCLVGEALGKQTV